MLHVIGPVGLAWQSSVQLSVGRLPCGATSGVLKRYSREACGARFTGGSVFWRRRSWLGSPLSNSVLVGCLVGSVAACATPCFCAGKGAGLVCASAAGWIFPFPACTLNIPSVSRFDDDGLHHPRFDAAGLHQSDTGTFEVGDGALPSSRSTVRPAALAEPPERHDAGGPDCDVAGQMRSIPPRSEASPAEAEGTARVSHPAADPGTPSCIPLQARRSGLARLLAFCASAVCACRSPRTGGGGLTATQMSSPTATFPSGHLTPTTQSSSSLAASDLYCGTTLDTDLAHCTKSSFSTVTSSAIQVVPTSLSAPTATPSTVPSTSATQSFSFTATSPSVQAVPEAGDNSVRKAAGPVGASCAGTSATLTSSSTAATPSLLVSLS